MIDSHIDGNVDGKPLLDQPRREGHAPKTATLTLHAGQPIHFTLIYHPFTAARSLGFGIRREQDLIDPANPQDCCRRRRGCAQRRLRSRD